MVYILLPEKVPMVEFVLTSIEEAIDTLEAYQDQHDLTSNLSDCPCELCKEVDDHRENLTTTINWLKNLADLLPHR